MSVTVRLITYVFQKMKWHDENGNNFGDGMDVYVV